MAVRRNCDPIGVFRGAQWGAQYGLVWDYRGFPGKATCLRYLNIAV